MADHKDDDSCPGTEFVIPVPGTELPDGGNMCIHHGPDHSMSLGHMHPIRDGVSIPDDAVICRSREGSEKYDVVGSINDMKASKSGPSMVNSKEFRNGWDNIFNKNELN